MGTLPYMAPELLRSVRGAAYTPSCDVYSLGIVLAEMVSQTVPYSDSLMEKVRPGHKGAAAGASRRRQLGSTA